MRTLQPIKEKILHFIQTVPMGEFVDDAFQALAVQLFQWQYENNAIYRGVCLQQNLSPRVITDWRNIPAVTTSAFKEVPLTCFPVHEATAVFHTSGTTQKRAGKHYFQTLDYYHAAMLRSFAEYCLTPFNKMRLLFLGPTSRYFPNSSLGYMFSGLRDEFGDEHSANFFLPGGVAIPALENALEKAIRENVPVFILGTALALLDSVENFQQRQRKFQLPFGSRMLDTGGYKGRRVEVERNEFQDQLCATFGISRQYLLNEYGMTELSSQFYESALVKNTSVLHSIHFASPWVRAVAVDPDNLMVLPEGEIGLLRIFDLANVDSVLAIQTEDLGRAWQDRLELLGRASGTELRGCSLLTEIISSRA